LVSRVPKVFVIGQLAVSQFWAQLLPDFNLFICHDALPATFFGVGFGMCEHFFYPTRAQPVERPFLAQLMSRR
jgi:hypothetical protein